MQILVVDDEIAIVELLTDILGDEGYDVVTAHDGKSALALLRAGLRPSVVITDLMMPNLDGMGLYRALRSELDAQQIGVVLVSAGSNNVTLNDARASFVPKPFNIDQLLTTIERLA
jgi:two-component system chemotaxis response regulator CheY